MNDKNLETAQTRGPAYLSDKGRDLRLDFIRGSVMAILLVNHLDIFSFWNYLVWERIGVVSGGEGFVIVSGIVLGMVQRRKLEKGPMKNLVNGSLDRASQLYRINIFVIVSVLALHLLPFMDATAAMTFHDKGSDTIYPLYPPLETPILRWVATVLLLRCGPHQFQIMGLYVVLLAITPLLIWVFKNRRTWLILAISWIVYFEQILSPSRPTLAQFEYGFPILAWQLIYIHGLAVGFHWKTCGAWLASGHRKNLLLGLCTVLFFIFLFFTWNNPNPLFPEFMRLQVIQPEVFSKLYRTYFLKNQLGILRIVNYVVVLVLLMTCLTRFWTILYKAFGWYLIPVGQATLYAFIVHVYLIVLFDQLGLLQFHNIWLNTGIQTLLLLIVWLMIRFKFAFQWIPR